MSPLEYPDPHGLDRILKPARLCGYVGQTVVISQRADGGIYCNYKDNNGCDEQTEYCRLHDAIGEQGAD